MKNQLSLLPVLMFVSLASCTKDQPVPVAPAPQVKVQPAPVEAQPATAKEEPPRYEYRGDRYRDPFVSLTGGGVVAIGAEEVSVPNISALTLRGIFADGKRSIAIINGGGISYILKDGRLYDNRQRMVKSIAGIIKKDSVIIIGPDKTTKELKLREK